MSKQQLFDDPMVLRKKIKMVRWLSKKIAEYDIVIFNQLIFRITIFGQQLMLKSIDPFQPFQELFTCLIKIWQ